MKKEFLSGFVIGIIYIFLFYLIITYLRVNEFLIAILIQPAGFIIKGFLEYILGLVNLRYVLSSQILFWSLLALAQGVFIGLVFIGFRKLFIRNS